jgi:hypothetical protein
MDGLLGIPCHCASLHGHAATRIAMHATSRHRQQTLGGSWRAFSGAAISHAVGGEGVLSPRALHGASGNAMAQQDNDTSARSVTRHVTHCHTTENDQTPDCSRHFASKNASREHRRRLCTHWITSQCARAIVHAASLCSPWWQAIGAGCGSAPSASSVARCGGP